MKPKLSIIMLMFIASCLFAQEGALKTDKDKVNYGIGVGVARNFQRQGIEVDLDSVIKGMRDVLSGAKLAVTEEELDKIMTAFQAEVQKKFQDKVKAIADKNKKEGDAFLAENSKKEGIFTLPSGLQYKILKAGNGKKPVSQDSVECHYRGTLINGAEFDSSYKRGTPLVVKVDGGIIPGWSEALKLMPLGSKWQLFIPSNLAYGERGAGSQIEPNASLIFEVEPLAIK
jgi:UDP-GlcNAc:undecaprenyl-phosphate/decaprenyl-phosphate GlcNAc-1-phosphate transferase